MLVNRYLTRNRGMLIKAFEMNIDTDINSERRCVRESTRIKSQESLRKASTRSMKPDLRYLIAVLEKHKIKREFFSDGFTIGKLRRKMNAHRDKDTWSREERFSIFTRNLKEK